MFIELLSLHAPPRHPRALRFFRVHYESKERLEDVVRLFHDTLVTVRGILYIADVDTPFYNNESDLKEYGLHYSMLITLRPAGLWSL